MRWQDMTPGEAYALAGDPRVKVTVLDTPAELRRQARVRVRFETGITAGRVCDIPSRRIGAPWGGTRSPKPSSAPRRKPEASVVLLSRQAQVGDTVTLDEMDDWIWTVSAVDAGVATISTLIFERPHTRTVALDALRVRAEPHKRMRVGNDKPRRASGLTVEPAAAAAERLRPITPRRELDELMDDVLFTNACVRDYDRELGAGQPGHAIERLREEVRRAGYVVREDRPRANEDVRIRVRGRFDIVLARKPTADAPLTIKGLYFPTRRPSRRRRRRPSSGQRRAA